MFLLVLLAVMVGLSFALPSFSASSAELLKPTLQVNIPDVKFSTATIQDDVLKINYLGDYIAGVYKYLLGISTTIAIVMVMVSGLQWTFGATSQKAISSAQGRIKNAVTGLVLLMSSYLILFTVNPNLIKLQFPQLDIIKFVNLEDLITGAAEACKDLKATVGKCSATTLTTPSSWNSSLTTIVNSVAATEKVDAILIATHLQKETGGNINYSRSIGPCGEIGISQFMPTTFESIVGQPCCQVVAAKISDTRTKYGKMCDDGAVADWPPNSSTIPNCNDKICGNCQVAQTSCIDYFDTSKSNGVQNSVTATAKLIKYNLNALGDDIALAMCAYNGSGKQAVEYAKSAAAIYASFCTASGGTQASTSTSSSTTTTTTTSGATSVTTTTP
ncbi:hypothetical protein HY733_02635 [Candidatus Uhrbacteria bacterium]|nr:hypothetical protein [Candidatus Uhrbacteria bacterium]